MDLAFNGKSHLNRGRNLLKVGGGVLRSYRACAQGSPTFFITLFERPKRVEKAAGLVLATCRSSAHSPNPYKLNPCAARVLNSARIATPLAPPANFAKNVNGCCGGPELK